MPSRPVSEERHSNSRRRDLSSYTQTRERQGAHRLVSDSPITSQRFGMRQNVPNRKPQPTIAAANAMTIAINIHAWPNPVCGAD
jgi:hypothetical protein